MESYRAELCNIESAKSKIKENKSVSTSGTINNLPSTVVSQTSKEGRHYIKANAKRQFNSRTLTKSINKPKTATIAPT